MKYIILLLLLSMPFSTFSQVEKKEYLMHYGIELESLNELSFKNEKSFWDFIKVFEEKEGFELPKFLIIDDSGKLLKHTLDIYQRKCGKGDVKNIKKKYLKDLPTIDELDEFFNVNLEPPKENHFIVIFIWIQQADLYNKHTFETYNTWKLNDNIEFYFLNLKYE